MRYIAQKDCILNGIKIALGVNILSNIIICILELWRDGVVFLKRVYEKYK